MKKKIVLLTLFLLSAYYLRATHIVAGDLTYRCIGDRLYSFTLTIYSECGALGQLDPKNIIYYFSPSQGIPASNPKFFELTQISDTEELVFCPTQITNCNGGGARGIKRVIYTGTIDLKSFGYAEDWSFYWKKSYRSEEITSLQLPAEEDFFILTTINNKNALCNNSPTFVNNPVVTTCAGEIKTYNHVAVDVDGDKLVYSLVTPQSDYGVEVIFKNGYSYNNFIGLSEPAVINSSSGDMTFKPTSKNEVGVTDVLVKEYRNGVLIGSVVRSMQVTTLDCSNAAPVISNFTSSDTDSVAVVAGTAVNFKVKVSDAEEQKISLKLLSGKLNGFFASNNNSSAPEGIFQWQTSVYESGKYIFSLEARDDGCPRPQISTKRLVIEVLPKYVEPKFKAEPRCLGTPTSFNDISTVYQSAKSGAITAWRWDFGDGNSSLAKDPQHTYSSSGTFNIKMVVTTANGFKDSVVQNLTICKPPVIDFQNIDYCSEVSVFDDQTVYGEGCEPVKRVWEWGDGTTTTSMVPELSNNEVKSYGIKGPNSKIFNVRLTVTTAAGCVISSPVKPITIYPNPVIDILENDLVFDCKSPLNKLHYVVTDTGSGKPNNTRWSTGETNTTEITVNTYGTFTVTVTDKKGCDWTDYIVIQYPLIPDFKLSPFCKPGDAIQFTDRSVTVGKPIKKWTWDFGDGSKSNERSPVHTYTNMGIYDVSLTIDDEEGCDTARFYRRLYNTYFTEGFEVLPKNASLCVSNAITIKGPVFNPQTDQFDSLEWDLGNGVVVKNRNRYKTALDTTVFYPQPGTYNISLKVWYNGINSGTSCLKQFGDKVTIHPELKVIMDGFRVCVNDPAKLSFKRIAGDLSIPIVRATWEITESTSRTKDILTELRPVYNFKGRRRYLITLTVEDALGCKFSTFKSFFAEVIQQPDFTFSSVCAKEPVEFKADFKNTYENITHVRWDFGDQDTLTSLYRKPMFYTKSFPRGGTYPVRLTAYNRFTKCEQFVVKEILIKEIPVIDFSFDTVCAGQPVSFKNLTSVVSGKVASWKWEFGDGNTSSEFEPSHPYQVGGTYLVKLIGTTEEGCTDFLEKSVYVKTPPIASFSVEEPLLEAYVPLHFKDQSAGDIVEYYWDFGDGTTSTDKDPVHQYDSVKLYKVTHIVTNATGCSDTIIVKSNLNVHLELPTAFSPNSDGQNDGLFLLHHGIKELYEFKLYNRWGELIFDAGNNLNAVWDGSFKGKQQEVGVYVAYVKALGVYNTHFNFKKNITLVK